MELLRCIFFDIGYTLVNEDKVWEQRCKEQADGEEAQNAGLTAEQIYEEIVLASKSCLPQYRTVVKKYGFREVAPYRHELEVLYEDAKPVLEKLSETYALGIIANQTDGLMERLREWGIDRYFSTVISSWDYQVMKPDQRIFRVALEKAGCRPEEAMMVGDRLDNDIYPAKALGMRTVWIKNGFGGMQKAAGEEYRPDYEVESLRELLNILG